MAPGSRREVLVRGGRPGVYPLQGDPLRVSSRAATSRSTAARCPTKRCSRCARAAARSRCASRRARALSKPLDLRTKHVDRKRTIVFSEMNEASGATKFMLNGMTFDPERTDVTMKLGSVEQWTLVNENNEWHTFHIHTNDFQVVSVAGKPVPYVDYQDNVALPPESKTVILMQPIDFTGKFVFHCHITFHEDHGMMATVQVVREPTAAQARRAVVRDGGLAISSAAYGSQRAAAVGPLAAVLLPRARASPRRTGAPSRTARRELRPAGARGLLISGASPAGPCTTTRRRRWTLAARLNVVLPPALSCARSLVVTTCRLATAAAAAPWRPGAPPARARASALPCAVCLRGEVHEHGVQRAPGGKPGGSAGQHDDLAVHRRVDRARVGVRAGRRRTCRRTWRPPAARPSRTARRRP